jgi:hypothetical protein
VAGIPELMGSTGSPIGMMRRSVFLPLFCAGIVLLGSPWAAAKGSTLRFDEATYAPGAHAVAHAVDETCQARGNISRVTSGYPS